MSVTDDGRRRLALVTANGAWETDEDAVPLVDALTRRSVLAEPAIWDDPGVDWSVFDLVVLRSPWDYTERVEEFLTWAELVAADVPLANPVEVLRWNTDKHYLGELAQRGLSVVPTSFVPASRDHGDVATVLPSDGRFVVKPTISSGSRNTARYEADGHAAALVHLRRLLDEGRDVMVQPYVESVEDRGETGMLFFDGTFSHAFRKGALLTGGAAKVEGLYAHEQIDPRAPDDAELTLARAAIGEVTDLFGGEAPLYARVDVLSSDDGVPMLLELELTEPSYFLHTDPASADRAAAAYLAALDRSVNGPGTPK